MSRSAQGRFRQERQRVLDLTLSALSEDTVIFSITNGVGKYPQLAVLWAKFLDKLNINNYIIYCLDKKSFNYLNRRGVRCQLAKKNPWINGKPFRGGPRAGSTVRIIGAYKVMLAKDLLKQGKNIVYADTDAFFCRDPLPHINELLDQYDCLWSTSVLGISQPEYVLNRIGVVGCGGFFALKGGQGGIDFISAIESGWSKRASFQYTVNFYMLPYIMELLLPFAATGSRRCAGHTERREAAFRIEGCHIKLLPQTFVRRATAVRDDSSALLPCIFHCLGGTTYCRDRGKELYKELYG